MQIWGRRKSGSDTELKFYGNIVSVYEQGKYESIRLWSIYQMKRTYNFSYREKKTAMISKCHEDELIN